MIFAGVWKSEQILNPPASPPKNMITITIQTNDSNQLMRNFSDDVDVEVLKNAIESMHETLIDNEPKF